jgi:hypothetical protein
MKTTIFFVFLCFSLGTISKLDGHIEDKSKAPHITSQHATADGGRDIYVHNPLNKAVWLFFECKNVISVHPIGVPATTTSEIHLNANEDDTHIDDEPCYINHWTFQGRGDMP